MKSRREVIENADHEPEDGYFLVDPQTAEIWRREYHYDKQRDIREWHAKNLADMMRTGKFLDKTQIAFCRLAGRYYLTNGQHTLLAIEKSGVSQTLSVVITECSSMAEVAEDFSRRDTHLTRTFGTALVAHGMDEVFGISRSMLDKFTAACGYYAMMNREVALNKITNLTHDQKLDIVRKHGGLCKRAIGLFDGTVSRTYLNRKTTLASAMFCLSHETAAEEFWVPLARDDGLRQGDPRKTLLEWLRNTMTPGGRSGNATVSGTRCAVDHELVKGIASAWNAWIEGRELKFIKINFNSPVATFALCGDALVRTEGKKEIAQAGRRRTESPAG